MRCTRRIHYSYVAGGRAAIAVAAAVVCAGTFGSGTVSAATARPLSGLASSGMSSAAGMSPAQPVPTERGHEATSLRTAYSSTFELPDGTRRTEFSPTPINYRNGSGGRWSKIDLDLQPSGGDLTASATPFTLRLPKALGDDGRVSVSHGGDTVSFRPHAERSQATTKRSTATYRGAYRGADASWSAAPNGVKEIISLRDRSAPRRFTYDLTLSGGLRPELTSSGQIEIRRGSDRVGVIPAPWMKDAAGETSSAASYGLRRAGNGWQIELSIDDDWVSAGDRKFPIAVDPSYELSQATWCTLSPGVIAPSGTVIEPPASCGTPPTLGDTNHKTVLMRFAHLSDSIPHGSQVLSASVNLNAINASTGGQPAHVLVRELSQPFDPAVLTGQPTSPDGSGPHSPWQDDGWGEWFARGKRIESKTTVAPVSGSPVPVSLGVSRLVQGWVDGYLLNPSDPYPAGSPFENRGLLISMVEQAGYLRFADGNSGVNGPRLSVVWEPRSGDRWSDDKRQLRVSPTEVVKVNRANGELLVDSRDVSVTGPLGPALTFSRVYSSRGDVPNEQGILGTTGWSDNVADPSLHTSGFDQTEILHWLDGGRYRFDENLNDGSWADGYTDRPMRLARRSAVDPNGTGLTVTPTVATTPDGQANDNNRYLFDNGSNGGLADDRLSKIVAPDGGAVTYTRMANGVRATDANGNWIKLHVADGKVDTVTDSTGKVWHYAYQDAAGDLTGVTTPDGWTTNYTYETDPTKPFRLRTITARPPTGIPQIVTVTYGADGKVTALASSSGSGGSGATFSYPTPYQTDETFTTPGSPVTGYRRTLSWRGTSYAHWDPTAKPTASASGALANLKDKYTKGDSTVDAMVTANRDAGSYLRSFGLRNTGLGRTLGTTNTNCTVPLPPPYASVVPRGDSCPNPASAQYSVNLTTMPEGANVFRAVATNDATLQGQSDPLTVYIDRTAPTNLVASGELWDLEDGYINGQGIKTVTVAAHDPLLEDDSRGSGIQHLALEDVGHGIIAQADVACDPNSCPVDASQALNVDASQLAEGAHQLRIVATDLVGHVSQSDPWTVLVDKTGPVFGPGVSTDPDQDADAPSLFSDAADGASLISWPAATDPDLADGNAGSDVDHYLWHYRASSTAAWSDWVTTADDGTDVQLDVALSHLELQVQAVDQVDNAGPIQSWTLDEGQQDPAPVPDYVPDPATIVDDDAQPVVDAPGLVEVEEDGGPETMAAARPSRTTTSIKKNYTCVQAWSPIQATSSGLVIGNCSEGTRFTAYRRTTYKDYPGSEPEGKVWVAGSLPDAASFKGCGWLSVDKRLVPGDAGTGNGLCSTYNRADRTTYMHVASRRPGVVPPANSKKYPKLYMWATVNAQNREMNGFKAKVTQACSAYANINPWRKNQTASGRIHDPFGVGQIENIRYLSRYRAKNPMNGNQLEYWIMAHTDKPDTPWLWFPASCKFQLQ